MIYDKALKPQRINEGTTVIFHFIMCVLCTQIFI